MLHKFWLALPLGAAAVFAQDPTAPTPPPKSSISGTVTVSGSGVPMPDVEVSVDGSAGKRIETSTDAQGRYTLRDVEPGPHRISANAPAANGRVGFGPNAVKQVTLQPGQELKSFDFQMLLLSRISGKVFDQNKEPVPGVTVILVTREYVTGTLRAVFASSANTDDQGNYTLERVQPGHTYLVFAKRRSTQLKAISDAPVEPKLRRPAVIPTFFPNSRSMEGAQPLVLRDGEHREGIDIRLVRGPSYCLDGVVEGGTGHTDLRFSIAETQPTSGTHSNGGTYMGTPDGTPGPDGKIRICDLHSGEYELTVAQYAKEPWGEAPFFGSAIVTVTDRDIQNVRLTAQPRVPLSGEVVWDVPAGQQPLEQKLNVFLQALSRTERGNASASIPGEFAFTGGLLMDDFAVSVRLVPKGIYIADMTYGARSVRHQPLRLGSAMGNTGLRITVSRNGGTVSARVADKDGNPVAGCTVVLMPAGAASDGIFASALVYGKTDQRGTWSSEMLPPGKYTALATNDLVNRSIDIIARLLRARVSGQDVDLHPGGTITLALVPKSLE